VGGEAQVPAARTSDGKWLPGRSGNPGGRPKEERVVLDLAREYAPAAVRELARIAVEGKSERCRVLAATALLDRAYGRPATVINGDGAGGFLAGFAALIAGPGQDADDGGA